MPSLESAARCQEEFEELFTPRLEMEKKLVSLVRGTSFGSDKSPHKAHSAPSSVGQALHSPEYHAWLAEYDRRIHVIRAKYDAAVK